MTLAGQPLIHILLHITIFLLNNVFSTRGGVGTHIQNNVKKEYFLCLRTENLAYPSNKEHVIQVLKMPYYLPLYIFIKELILK